MTFRIVLTVMFALEAYMVMAAVGQSRRPYTHLDSLVQSAGMSVLIFGIWRWL